MVPDPSTFFSPHLLSAPLPTNSFFQNFVLKNGDQPEYIHPYLIKSAASSLDLCYPSRFSTSGFIYQTFVPDLAISSGEGNGQRHVVSSFDDLSVTVDLPPSLRFFLVRGSPFVTCSTLCPSQIKISTVHAFTSVVSSNESSTKHRFQLSNGQTYLCYSSAPLRLSQTEGNVLVSSDDRFSGVVRVAVLVDPIHESVLDRFSTCYPVSGSANIGRPFSLEYRWEKKGWGGDLLLLAHPLHLRLLKRRSGRGVTVLENFKYSSIDGDLVGVAGDSWVLKTDPISITWHSIGGVREEGHEEIISSLVKDVDGLDSTTPIATPSSYFYGKAIARAARFAVIAEEVGFTDVIPKVRSFLKSSITPWLDGTFHVNGFHHENKWGGIITKQGSMDSGADFGFGIYNDHHYHLGYFLYAAAVLSKIDHAWGRKYKPQVYSMVADIMNLSKKPTSRYARLRCFDLWKLHSWAGGLTEFADGRNQESTSEAVNAYYSAGLLGLSYGDTHLLSTASTLASLEILSAEMWWHVKPSSGEGGIMYEEDFGRENRFIGVLWANKRDSGLWFAPPDWRECRLGIQVLPLLPVTEVLFRDVGFLESAVKWAESVLGRDGVGEGWKGFLYALEGVYDREDALEKTRELKGFDDGNSASNLLWWLHSRRGSVVGDLPEKEDTGDAFWRSKSWFSHYCH